MSTVDLSTDDLAPLQREGLEWLSLITSGKATEADLAALERWKGQSLAHAQALVSAAKLWRMVSSQTAFNYVQPHFLQRPATTRRLALTGFAAAVVGYAVIRPPLGLWPSVAELSSDYRTGIGEQRRVVLADGVSAELDTRTSLSLRAVGGRPGIKLVTGQVALKTDLPKGAPFTVLAGGGRVVATTANFNVRVGSSGIDVFCLDGDVRVEAGTNSRQLRSREKILLAGDVISVPEAVDPELETAWRQGRLLFHNTPFQTIVAEVNRYRPGRIVIVNPALEGRQFNAAFDVKNIEKIVTDLQLLSKASVTALPGGVVLLA